jgi:hypothetical protein
VQTTKSQTPTSAANPQAEHAAGGEARAGVHAQLRSVDFQAGSDLLAPVQRRPSGAAVQMGGEKDAKPPDKPKLLTDFAADFADAAKAIEKSSEGMALVGEAAKAGVEYGGHAETGPAKDAWPYTVGNKVYVPKASTAAVKAMSDFLFELNNAIRKPAFDKLHEGAAKGSKSDDAAARKYARDIVAQEVEGMLRLGKVWAEAKKALGGGKELDAFDADFYRSEYEAYEAKTKTKDDIVSDVLKRTYTSGVDAGKTVEQYYMESYRARAQNK